MYPAAVQGTDCSLLPQNSIAYLEFVIISLLTYWLAHDRRSGGAVCRHCLQILTAKTIKIWKFHTVHHHHHFVCPFQITKL